MGGQTGSYDIHTPDAVELRFGIQTLENRQEDATAVLSLPMVDMRNPVSGAGSLAPLAVLVDHAGSTVAFARRGEGWPVSSELNLQLNYDALSVIEGAEVAGVTARAHLLDHNRVGALARCVLGIAGDTIGTGTVRAVYIHNVVVPPQPSESMVRTADTSLAELLAVRPSDEHPGQILQQMADPMVFNATGSVHGGVAAAGLELAASAHVWEERHRQPFRTCSLQVNFLRPMVAGNGARYTATTVNIGSTVAVVDAQAVGDNSKTAAVGRLTAYR